MHFVANADSRDGKVSEQALCSSRLPSAIYRFIDHPSEDDMKKFMNKAIDEMAAETVGQGE